MPKRPASNGTADLSARTRDDLTALVGFLHLADAPNVTEAQRVQFAAAAYRNGHALRRQFPGRLLIVVDRQQGRYRERLRRTFAQDDEVEVILDRRQGERRRASGGRLVDRRQRDRRQQNVDHELARLGVALISRAALVPAPADGQSRSARTRPCRVLLIDDDPAIVEALGSYLEGDEGYVVEAAFSGDKGLSALAAHRPDVVLLDVNMPGMSGLEVLKRIRKIDTSIPVIMVTGASHDEASDALANGAFAYIPKPFDFRYFDHLVTLATTSSSSGRRR